MNRASGCAAFRWSASSSVDGRKTPWGKTTTGGLEPAASLLRRPNGTKDGDLTIPDVSYHSLNDVCDHGRQPRSVERRCSPPRSRRSRSGGLHGTSTEEIARGAGISQPYLFRLFGTKKKLFLATIDRCMADTLESSARQPATARQEALDAMPRAYVAMLTSDRTRLLAQMEGYAACDDLDVRDAMRGGHG